VNIGPPTFSKTLASSIKVYAGKELDYPLPKIADPDNDDYTISVNFKTASDFSVFKESSSTLTFMPTPSHIGTHQIVVTLTDHNIG
jgi:hypothetical protein